MQYIIIIPIFMAGFLFMAAALHFSRYKKRGSCCYTGLDEVEKGIEQAGSSCFTCPNHGKEHECDSLHQAEHTGA